MKNDTQNHTKMCELTSRCSKESDCSQPRRIWVLGTLNCVLRVKWEVERPGQRSLVCRKEKAAEYPFPVVVGVQIGLPFAQKETSSDFC